MKAPLWVVLKVVQHYSVHPNHPVTSCKLRMSFYHEKKVTNVVVAFSSLSDLNRDIYKHRGERIREKHLRNGSDHCLKSLKRIRRAVMLHGMKCLAWNEVTDFAHFYLEDAGLTKTAIEKGLKIYLRSHGKTDKPIFSWQGDDIFFLNEENEQKV